MQIKLTHAIPALLLVLLSACGEKAAEPEAAPAAPAAEAPAAEAPAPAAPAVVEAGGYTPTPEELVPGITLTQAEIDAKYAEARALTPLPVIPGEAPAAPAAEPPAAEAPAAEAPAEKK